MSGGWKVLLFLVGLCCCVAGQQQECECVEYYLCDEKHGTIITDGTNLLDVRTRPCPGVQVCCLLPPEGGSTSTSRPDEPNPTPPNPEPIPTDETPGPNPGGLQIPNITPGTGCGRRRFPANIDTGLKVTGGDSNTPQTTFYGEAPWMVVILQKKEALTFKCGGTLILPNVVLTAAHCVKNVPVEELSVRAGEYDNRITNKPIPTQTQAVRKVVSHPDFNSGNLHNDIALVFLEQPVELNAVVDVICGPEKNQTVIGSDCQVTGWGRSAKNGSYQAVLSKVNLPLKSRESCLEKLRTSRLGTRFILHEGFICAGGEDKRDTCKGDGGGPLYCPSKADPNKMVQIGIVAWGIGCGEGFPTVFASVEHYLPWVQKQLS
ncbi:phenoloxidase-activating factor 2 [Halyomorpha halys]|uniref:phenoloxidase-activating factor 2 n=1 Tax=Halyomorpha halys TaxID=286706 RepID=UPI0006D51D5B|nr:phenoloxidase-activating factor 2 [Halyomorpha halys]